MFLGLIAVLVAFYALVRAGKLAARVRKLEDDRDDLRTRLGAQHRILERLREAPSAPDDPVRRAASAASAPAEPPPASNAAETSAGPPAVAARKPDPEEEARTAAEQPAAAAPPTPPRAADTHAPASAPPSSSPIDWESLLGVKGAAWVGGIALITSAILFARWTIDQDVLSRPLRFALMLFPGLAVLASAEIGLRRGYERTANPLSGAGIAILYIAFFAGHARYELISMPVAFLGMVLVTASACFLAVRYDAFATAVLGLLGGFATPVALSTGEDRPVALFAYIFVLNLGLLALGTRKRWPGLFELGFLGTLVIQIGWFERFMSAENLLVALVSFAALGMLYLALPLVAGGEDSARVLRTGALGGLAPFLFAVYIGGSPDYVDQWPLLFGMMALLDLAILAVAVLRGRAALLLSASVATSMTLVVWAVRGLDSGSGASIGGATAAAILIASIFGLGRRVGRRFGQPDRAAGTAIEFAALVAWSGLWLFGLLMLGHDRGSPVTPFLILLGALVFFLLEQATGAAGRLRGALSVGALAAAILGQFWFFRTVEAATLLPFLAVPVGLAVVFSLFAGRKTGEAVDTEAEIAVRAAAWIGILGLFVTLALSSLAASGWPLFLALAAQVLVITGSILRSDWTLGLPALLAATSFHLLVWQLAYLEPDQYSLAMGVSALCYVFFLTLPMIVPFARWREAVLPWVTSALAGPVFFPPLYNVYQNAFGDALIGLLPLAMAGVCLGAIRVVSNRFVEGPPDALAGRLRLRYLALFTAVALWFIAVAVPLQLDRQWITLSWAIEAMALCWLFGHLPHRGLPAFAFVLYGLVGVRLLLNPEILGYEERGLPLFNWILYTYGIATACCLIGQALLRRVSSDRLIHRLSDGIGLTGLLLGFWLVNLEILDYFSTGPYITLAGQSGYAVKLALSGGWGLYAAVLLAMGVAKDKKPLRYISLGFLLLTVAKVFLYDLAELGGIFRVFSFLGLAIGLILVSLFYQRFVFARRQ